MSPHGRATITAQLSAGGHPVVARYAGDAHHNSSASAPLELTVATATPIATSTDLQVSPSTTWFGSQLTLTASVSAYPQQATGTVSFSDTSTNEALGRATLVGATATLTVSTLAAGRHAIVATYLGDSSCSGSSSPARQVDIQPTPAPATATTSINASTSTTIYDQPVTFTVHVTGGSGVATGTVTFTDAVNGGVLAVQKLVSGSTAFTTRALAVGSRSMTATYSGDQIYSPSVSSAADVSVSAPAGGVATNVQINAAHDGDASAVGLAPATLHEAWADPFALTSGSESSVPVIADGRVFLSLVDFGGNGRSTLYALDAATGVVDWSATRDTGYGWSGVTYDGGQVFAEDGGAFGAFNAETGHLNWTSSPDSGLPTPPPTAFDGVLYDSDGAALRESDGMFQWRGANANLGDEYPVTVADSGMYSGQACAHSVADTLAGTQKWFVNGTCQSGIGGSVALHGSLVYVPDNDLPQYGAPETRSQANGALVGTFPYSYDAPAFDSQHLYVTNDSLVAADSTGATTLWSFDGDGHLATPPLTANHTVYVASNYGKVYGVDATSGTKVWTSDVPNISFTNAQVGMAIGDNLLVVDSGGTVTAFSN